MFCINRVRFGLGSCSWWVNLDQESKEAPEEERVPDKEAREAVRQKVKQWRIAKAKEEISSRCSSIFHRFFKGFEAFWLGFDTRRPCKVPRRR